MKEYIVQPMSVTVLADEIKKICDGYWNREVSIECIEDKITIWANGPKMFYARKIERERINRSIKTIIGSKRLELIFALLKI